MNKFKSLTILVFCFVAGCSSDNDAKPVSQSDLEGYWMQEDQFTSFKKGNLDSDTTKKLDAGEELALSFVRIDNSGQGYECNTSDCPLLPENHEFTIKGNSLELVKSLSETDNDIKITFTQKEITMSKNDKSIKLYRVSSEDIQKYILLQTEYINAIPSSGPRLTDLKVYSASVTRLPGESWIYEKEKENIYINCESTTDGERYFHMTSNYGNFSNNDKRSLFQLILPYKYHMSNPRAGEAVIDMATPEAREILNFQVGDQVGYGERKFIGGTCKIKWNKVKNIFDLIVDCENIQEESAIATYPLHAKMACSSKDIFKF